MKKIQLISSIILICIVFYGNTYAQLINIQRFIGKSQIDLINELGAPVHFDNSNPSMMYMNYNFLSIQCIADHNSIYKVQLSRNYTSEKEAYDDIRDFILCSTREGFLSDSISSRYYTLESKDINTEITIEPQKDSPNLLLKIVTSSKQSNK